MAPVIRVSEGTFERLKRFARPFEDTPEDIIRLALDALEGVPSPKWDERSDPQPKAKKRRSARGQKLGQSSYRIPILKVIESLGGKATVQQIRKGLLTEIEKLLTPVDFQLVSSGDPRWWNTACWERNEMVKDGLLKSNSQRGVWELALPQQSSQHEAVLPAQTPHADLSLDLTWLDDVNAVVQSLDKGSGVPLVDIYRNVREARQRGGRTIPHSLDAIVRRTLEENCRGCESFKGLDLFQMVKGKGAGVWGLK